MKGNFTKLEDWIFDYLPQMSARELKIYLCLKKHYNRTKKESWPGRDVIAKETGIKSNGKQDGAKEGLKAKGLIRVKRRGARGKYIFDVAQTTEEAEAWKAEYQIPLKRETEEVSDSFKEGRSPSFKEGRNHISKPDGKPPSNDAPTESEREEGGGLPTPPYIPPQEHAAEPAPELSVGAQSGPTAKERDWTALVEAIWQEWISRQCVEKDQRLTLDRQITKHGMSSIAQAMLKIDGKDNPNGYIAHLIAALNP